MRTCFRLTERGPSTLTFLLKVTASEVTWWETAPGALGRKPLECGAPLAQCKDTRPCGVPKLVRQEPGEGTQLLLWPLLGVFSAQQGLFLPKVTVLEEQEEQGGAKSPQPSLSLLLSITEALPSTRDSSGPWPGPSIPSMMSRNLPFLSCPERLPLSKPYITGTRLPPHLFSGCNFSLNYLPPLSI